MSGDGGFLPSLTRAFKSLDAQTQVNTRAFVEAVELILPVFDDLGKSQALQRIYLASLVSGREKSSSAADLTAA